MDLDVNLKTEIEWTKIYKTQILDIGPMNELYFIEIFI